MIVKRGCERVLVCFVVLLAMAEVPSPEAAAVTKNEIIDVLRRRAEGICRARVTWNAKKYIEGGTKTVDVEGIEFALDGEKTFYHTPTSNYGEDGNTHPWQWYTSTFNEEEGRLYSPAGKIHPTGTIFSKNMDIGNINLRALLQAFRPLHPKVTNLASPAYSLMRSESVIQGRACVGLRETPGTRFPGAWRVFWMDRERGYIILKYESYTKSPVTGESHLTAQLTTSYRPDPEYGWVPSGWNAMILNGDTGVFAGAQAEVVECSINEPIPSALFTFDFPSGTYVKDLKNGRRWIVREGGKRRYITAAERARNPSYEELLATESGMAGLARRPYRTYIYGTIVGLFLVALGYEVARRIRRQRAGAVAHRFGAESRRS